MHVWTRTSNHQRKSAGTAAKVEFACAADGAGMLPMTDTSLFGSRKLTERRAEPIRVEPEDWRRSRS